MPGIAAAISRFQLPTTRSIVASGGQRRAARPAPAASSADRRSARAGGRGSAPGRLSARGASARRTRRRARAARPPRPRARARADRRWSGRATYAFIVPCRRYLHRHAIDHDAEVAVVGRAEQPVRIPRRGPQREPTGSPARRAAAARSGGIARSYAVNPSPTRTCRAAGRRQHASHPPAAPPAGRRRRSSTAPASDPAAESG